MFDMANKSKTTNLGAVDAVNFLRTSGLPEQKLIEIFRFSARTRKDQLTRDEFYCMLRMVSYFQNDI